MKKTKLFLYLLGLSLAFLAGYHLRGTDKHQHLQVLYMDDPSILTTPVEQQVLALVLSDPYHDAQMAVLAKDYRRATILGANTRPRPKPEEVKTLPLNDYIRSFGQKQVMMAATNYVQAYNDSLSMLLSNPLSAEPAVHKSGTPP